MSTENTEDSARRIPVLRRPDVRVGIGSLAALALACVAAYVVDPHGAVSLPDSVDGLVLQHDATAQAAADTFSESLAAAGQGTFADALIGVYRPQTDDGYAVIVLDQPTANLVPGLAEEIRKNGPRPLVQQDVYDGHLDNATFEQSADAATSLECGTQSISGLTVTTCVWGDSASFGLAFFVPTPTKLDLSRAAAYTDALRGTAERR